MAKYINEKKGRFLPSFYIGYHELPSKCRNKVYCFIQKAEIWYQLFKEILAYSFPGFLPAGPI